MVRFGILSAAAIAKKHFVEAIQKTPGCRVEAVTSRNETKARKFAEHFAIPRHYSSYEDLLADKDIDAVYIPLPTALHVEWVKKAIAASKHVLCEKPFSLHSQEVLECQQLAEQAGVVVAEAAMYRYNPCVQRIGSLLQQGEIGKLRHISSLFFNAVEDADFRMDPRLGGGALSDLGFYCVGISSYFANSQLRGCSATALKNDLGADIRTMATLQFENGVDAIFGCALQGDFVCRYELFGSEGSIHMPYGGMVAWPGTAFDIVISNSQGTRTETIEPQDHYSLLVADFAQAITSGNPMRWDLQSTREITQIIEKLYSLIQ